MSSLNEQIVQRLPENSDWFFYRAAEGDSYVFCGPAPNCGAPDITKAVSVSELPFAFLRGMMQFAQLHCKVMDAAAPLGKVVISGEASETFSENAVNDCQRMISALQAEIKRLKQELVEAKEGESLAAIHAASFNPYS